MSKYMTRQRKVLLSYLSGHADELLSAQAIADALGPEAMSLSAVYRNLSELEGEGKLRRASKGNQREIYYQYIDAESCKGALHLSCKKCGKTFHMEPEAACQLLDAVARMEGLAVDKSDTVLYGVCGGCQEEKER